MTYKRGINSPRSNLSNAGVGFILAPIDVQERKQYIENCYRTKTVSLSCGVSGGAYRGVHVSTDILQKVTFPNETSRGSSLVWVKDGISNLPIVVGYIEDEDDFTQMKERSYRVTRMNDEKVVDVFIDADTTTLNINLRGDEKDPATLAIKLGSTNADSKFSLNCDNEINITAEKQINLVTTGKLSQRIVNQEGKQQAILEYEVEKGFLYEDEFGNKIEAIKDVIQINGGKNRGVINIKQIESLIKALSADLLVAKSGSNLSQWMASEMPLMEDKKLTH